MIDNMTFGTLDVIAPQGAGGALQLPIGFWEPGTLSAYKGHFGTGATAMPFTASLVVGPSLTSPISINTVGLEVLTGVRNLFGADSTIGSDMSFGALDVSYSALGNQINAALFDIVPLFENVTPKDSLTAALGTLNGGWLINGLPISGEPDLTSDSRLKKNVETYSGGLATILGLRPVRFDWKEDKCPDSFLNEYREPDTKDGYPGKIKRQYGLIAQEVELLAPDLIGQRKMYKETYKLIRYEKIVPILISAVQEQQEQIEELKREIKSLKENK
jgi:hypothetical protein